ncbi:hypothetical protein AV530_011930 [Patagioenas fasciata monilis]|uniref:Uncharacterized protein n=1 Tax=Patagioenas fasciata monilis TaxID=372326 RepID=A0A1V4JUH3_PATFA|nr:hypothetical protein AV530_011930 [Patagioenas fasciata monilis]
MPTGGTSTAFMSSPVPCTSQEETGSTAGTASPEGAEKLPEGREGARGSASLSRSYSQPSWCQPHSSRVRREQHTGILKHWGRRNLFLIYRC